MLRERLREGLMKMTKSNVTSYRIYYFHTITISQHLCRDHIDTERVIMLSNERFQHLFCVSVQKKSHSETKQCGPQDCAFPEENLAGTTEIRDIGSDGALSPSI